MSYLPSLVRLLNFKRRHTCVVVVLLAIPSFSAVASATESSIDELIKSKQYAAALPLIEKNLSKGYFAQPDLLNKVRCLQALNRWEEASEPLMWVQVQKNLTGQNLFDYCLLSIEEDRHNHEYAAAEHICETLVGIDPEHASKWRAQKKEFSQLAQKSKSR